MKDFLDRIVARAGREGTFLRPRVAHRFGPPEHHIAASDGSREPGRDDGDGVPAQGDPTGSTDGPAYPVTVRSASPRSAAEGGQGPAGKAGGETDGASWSSAQTGGATRSEAGSGQRQPAPALSALGAEPTAGAPHGPAAASDPVPTNDSPVQGRQGSQDSFAERLRARLREARTAGADGAPEQGNPFVAATSPGGGPLDTTVPGTAEVKSRSARNEDAFWRFLYGPRAEAPTSQKRSADEERTDASAEASATTGSSSRLQVGAAAVRGAARATTTGAGTPARPMTVAVGRIEVRVQAPPVAPRPAAVPKRHPPRLGLADYMRQSASGDRRR